MKKYSLLLLFTFLCNALYAAEQHIQNAVHQDPTHTRIKQRRETLIDGRTYYEKNQADIDSFVKLISPILCMIQQLGGSTPKNYTEESLRAAATATTDSLSLETLCDIQDTAEKRLEKAINNRFKVLEAMEAHAQEHNLYYHPLCTTGHLRTAQQCFSQEHFVTALDNAFTYAHLSRHIEHHLKRMPTTPQQQSLQALLDASKNILIDADLLLALQTIAQEISAQRAPKNVSFRRADNAASSATEEMPVFTETYTFEPPTPLEMDSIHREPCKANNHESWLERLMRKTKKGQKNHKRNISNYELYIAQQETEPNPNEQTLSQARAILADQKKQLEEILALENDITQCEKALATLNAIKQPNAGTHNKIQQFTDIKNTRLQRLCDIIF